TLVLQVEGFGTGQRLLLSGPGIADLQSFSAQPLPPDFQARIAANRALFPRGVVVILVSPHALAALPRSAASTRGSRWMSRSKAARARSRTPTVCSRARDAALG